MTSPRPDRMIAELGHFIASFSQRPPVRLRPHFGHITLPHSRLGEHEMIEEIHKSSSVQDDSRLFFIVSQFEKGRLSTLKVDDRLGACSLPPVILTFAEFLAVLKDNRNERGAWSRSRKSADQPKGWDMEQIMPCKVLIALDLDPSMPAECALALLATVEWAFATARERDSAPRVLTMSNDRRCGMLSGLVTLHIPSLGLEYLDLTGLGAQGPADNVHVSRAETDAEMVEEIQKAIESTPGHPHLILSFRESNVDALFLELTDASGEKLVDASSFTSDDPIERLCDLLNGENHLTPATQLLTILTETPLQPMDIVGFADIHVVVNNLADDYQGWDDDTRHVLQYSRGPTPDEKLERLQWARQPHAQRVYIYAGRAGIDPLPQEGQYRHRQIEDAQLGGFIAAVFDLASSSSVINPRDVLALMLRFPHRTAEVLDRLTVQGIVSQTRLALPGCQSAVFQAVLPIVRYDHRLALFLALDSDATVRLVKTQLAALLTVGLSSVVEVYTRQLQDLACANPELLQDMYSECWGYGRSLAAQGTMWLVLGLWKRSERRKVNLDKASARSRNIDRLIQCDPASACKVSELAHGISAALQEQDIRLPQLPVYEEYSDLDETQTRELQTHLLEAGVYQLTVGHAEEGDDGQDSRMSYTSVPSFTEKVRVGALNNITCLVDFDDFFEAEGSQYSVGICWELIKNPQGIFAADWTWIPVEFIVEWNLKHAPDMTLVQALKSGIQHPEGNADETF